MSDKNNEKENKNVKTDKIETKEFNEALDGSIKNMVKCLKIWIKDNLYDCIVI